MRLRHLLVFLVSILSLFNTLQGQVNKYQFSMLSDSLKGFNESYHKSVAASEGLFGDTFKDYIAAQQRAFIILKYNLAEHEDQPGATISFFRPLGNVGTINNAPCVNEDFESGSLTGWTASRGRNNSSQVYPTFTTNISAGSQVSVVTTPLTDPFVGAIPHSPLGGTKVVRINNTSVGTAAVIRIQQTFSVTLTNYLFDFAYWAVMRNATGHNCTETPYMAVRIRNFTGTLQACPNFSIVAPSTGANGCAGIGPTTWTNVGTQYMTNTGWQKFSIDLTPYMGQNVTVEAYVAHCSPTAHFGYAYFDSRCNTMDVAVNGQQWSMPTTVVSPTVLCGTTATMVAPDGLGPYKWFGPSGSGINGTTSRTVITTVPGNYTLEMSPSGICNPPMQKVISLSFVPPTTVTATPSVICSSGSNTVSTLSASGGASYTWIPGGMTGATATVSPSTSTIYTLTAQSGTCIGNFTTEVIVAPDPTVQATASSPSVCAGGSTTLTATGADSFTWFPGALTGSQVVVNPTSNTTYTVVGTNSGGCQGSDQVFVGISITPTVSVFPAVSPTVCAGTPVTLVGLGSGVTSFSWYPTNPQVVGQVVALTPSVTTQYTVVGTTGSCTDAAVHTITVDPGPPMTVTANPTITCPGVNATLSVVAPTSLGFTWTPGGSTANSIVVNPPVSTVYSVTGVNANGCRSTYTINKLVAPLPNVTFSPATPTVCVGSSIVLTANGGNSYTWNPGSVISKTLLASPAVNTAYTVTASNGTCSSTGTVMVNVVPVPTVVAAASPTAICRGKSTLLTSSGASSYVWQPGGGTAANVIVTPLNTTTYSLTGSAGGCSSTSTVLVVVNPLPTITAVANPPAVCPGICSTLTPSGATTYTYANGGPVVCPASNTTYSVSGTNSFGCVSAGPGLVTVTVNPAPGIVLSPASATICQGSSVTVNASGALNFTWNPGGATGTSRSLSPAVTTIYTVSGTSAQGCIGQNTIQVTVISNPIVNASAAPATVCAGGTVNLSATGANSYTWMPGTLIGGIRTVTPAATTVYTVTGSTSGCVNTATVRVTVNPRPNITLAASPSSVCPGFCSTLTPSGGTNYTFSPSGPQVCPVTTTTYTVNGVNSFGCTDLTPPVVSVGVHPAANFNLTASTPSICQGGSSTITASGASSYNWQPGNLSGAVVSVSPNVTTTYTVTGSSAGGCVTTRTIAIVVQPTPLVNASASPASICAGASSTLSATGAASYLWMPGSLSGQNVAVNPVATTIYTVTGTTGGCSASRTVGVNVMSAPAMVVSASPASICGTNCSTLSVSGGSSYTWMPGNLTGSPVQVCPTVTTIYTVTGSNLSGCSSNQTVAVTVNPGPSISASASSPSICAGSTVALSASGGNTYVWTPGGSSSNPLVVSPSGTTIYTVVGTNASGCSGQATVGVVVVPVPVVNGNASPAVICAGGSSTLSASGASSYIWNPGNQPGSTVLVSPAVTTIYTLTGTSLGCSAQRTVQVTVNPLPVVTATTAQDSVCAGGCTTLTANGANSYTWNPGNLVGAAISACPLSTTVYTVTGRTSAGCTSTAAIVVYVNPAPSIAAAPASQTICAGTAATLVATGGTSYNWQPGNLTGGIILVSPNITTSYTVTGMGSSGCTATANAIVVVNPKPVVTVVASSSAVCAGNCSSLTATGALSYNWSNGSSSNPAVVCPATTTSYSVVGTNAFGCTSNVTAVTVSVNPPANVFAVATPTAICAGSSSTLFAGGGITYTWMPGGATGLSVSVSPLTTTIYTVTAFDGTCTGTGTVAVQVNPAPVVTIAASSNSVCFGLPVVLTALGGTSHTWQPGGQVSQVFTVSPNVTTTYTVTAANVFGCTRQASITINVIPPPNVTASSSPPAVCAGSCATLTASGAVSYTWIPGFVSGATRVVCPGVTTTYTVIGQQGMCGNFTTITVPVLPQPTVSAIASHTLICAGGSSSLAATGGTSYNWMPGNLSGPNVIVSPLVSTTYTVTGFNGTCAKTATVRVNVSANPLVSASASSPTVCAGGVVTLNASGASSYVWLPGPGSAASITVAPLSTTIYTVTGQSATGCSGTATVLVQVQPKPTINVTSPMLVCPGTCTNLFASGASSYTWLPMGTIGNSVTVCPTALTFYTVVGSIGSCTNGTITSVGILPAPVIGTSASPQSICAGMSSTLSASGASSYTWMPGGLTGPQVVVTPPATTIYTVSGTSSSGACTKPGTIVIVVTPNPTLSITGPSTLCAGAQSALSASGASSFTWFPGALTGSMIPISPLATTVYTVVGTQGNCTSSATLTVIVSPVPALNAQASPASICTGGSSTLSATGAASYTWQPAGLTGPAISVAPAATTVYTVTGVSASGCSSTRTVVVNVSSLPVINISSTSNTICAGNQATLTANGTTSFTWLPMNTGGTSAVVAPGATTTYTIIGSNGPGCTNTITFTQFVSPAPTINIIALATTVCAGSTTTLTATGANSFTWEPGAIQANPAIFVVNAPTIYTVTGEANGCAATKTIFINTTPLPAVSAVASATSICQGGTATLYAVGASNYTWYPIMSTGITVTVSPTSSTTYTVNGTDANGCTGSSTVMVTVFPAPTLTVTPVNSTVCAGSSATLTASGATSYTWLPSGNTQSMEIVTPTAFTTYTVIGANGGICSSTLTADVFVAPLPTGVVATSAGTVTCASPSATLFGSSTDANVSFSWIGPSGFTSTAQNPTVSIWGTFTLNVTSNITGCTAAATVSIPTDNSIPSVTATASGSITCSSGSVVLNAMHTTFSATTLWSGPSGFTSTASQATVTEAGTYSVVVTDLLSNCTGSTVVTVGTHTEVTVTASITAVTCSAGISLNDGAILVGNYDPLDKFDLVAGNTYTGNMTYTSAITMPLNGIITANLANPTNTVAYTLRVFDTHGCVKDFVLELVPVDCTPRALGIAKSVSTPTSNGNGTYKVVFAITVVNYDAGPLTNVVLEDNLALTFPAPATFTRGMYFTGDNGSLIFNSSYDGSADTKLTTATSSLSPGDTEFIFMEVDITPNGSFGPFHNTATGTALDKDNLVLSDQSTNGNNPDPDDDNNPLNNSDPTTFSLTPELFFGITKVGEYKKLPNNSFDVSYTITAHNLGNDTVRNIAINDSLFNNTIRHPASYTVKGVPVVTGALAPNSQFDGRFSASLTDPETSILAPGTTASVSFTVNVIPDTVTVLVNSAHGSATGAFDGSVLRDISNNGTNPDSNSNGVWNEEEDNVPTVLVLPVVHTYTLFVPEGFSPDGDGVNDFFVIRGLPETGENSLTVFNRWGNKVYYSGNYNNSWNGHPNVNGTLGKDKLPPGTYYFVLEFKGSGEARTGFVVLQY